jgi:hypothetical protein
MDNFIINEFIKERKPSGPSFKFENFDKVEDFVKTFKDGVYSNRYKFEPPYPYLWVRIEEITDGGYELPASYCYFAE